MITSVVRSLGTNCPWNYKGSSPEHSLDSMVREFRPLRTGDGRPAISDEISYSQGVCQTIHHHYAFSSGATSARGALSTTQRRNLLSSITGSKGTSPCRNHRRCWLNHRLSNVGSCWLNHGRRNVDSCWLNHRLRNVGSCWLNHGRRNLTSCWLNRGRRQRGGTPVNTRWHRMSSPRNRGRPG